MYQRKVLKSSMDGLSGWKSCLLGEVHENDAKTAVHSVIRRTQIINPRQFPDCLDGQKKAMNVNEIRLWSNNPDQFFEDEDEDDDSYLYSVRISTQDLLLKPDVDAVEELERAQDLKSYTK